MLPRAVCFLSRQPRSAAHDSPCSGEPIPVEIGSVSSPGVEIQAPVQRQQLAPVEVIELAHGIRRL